jgi:protein involved in temperature-dependent protein secretion
MSVDACIQAGDFEGALAQLSAQTAGAQADPGLLLTRFNMEIRVQQFEAAEVTMRRLLAAAPQVADRMSQFGRAGRAEATATARLTNPAVAGKRATIGAPPPHALVYVKAAVLHAQRDHAGAAAALAEAKACTPAVAGTLTWGNGRAARFVNLTDSDDLTGPNLPCYDGETPLDLPYSELRSMDLLFGSTSFDVMWIPADVVMVDGKALKVRIPSNYLGTGRAAEPGVRTGGETMWAHERGYAQAAGMRDFKATMDGSGGASMIGILQMKRIDFENKARVAPAPEKPKGFWQKLFG